MTTWYCDETENFTLAHESTGGPDKEGIQDARELGETQMQSKWKQLVTGQSENLYFSSHAMIPLLFARACTSLVKRQKFGPPLLPFCVGGKGGRE
ncbi:hypothetical protein WAI453_013677 [Rhynchosporium graminicola]